MAAPSYLSPRGNGVSNEDPFATPSRSSLQSASATGHPYLSRQEIEMQQGANGMSSVASRPARPGFLQRWRQADERAYLLTLGRLGTSRITTGEKARRRRTPPACICTIISAVLAVIVIVAIVVPIAVVFSSKSSNSAASSNPSSPGNSSAPAPNSNTVTLNQGSFRGTQLNNGITQFLGMQYAAPPTGDLRFAAPQPPLNFTGVKAATRYGPGCHGLGSFDSSQNEDCLYLDVFTPSNFTNTTKLPVFVFIQGGGLQNSATHFNGSNLIVASDHQMITVTMTYRVNAFGFLASSEIQKGASLNNGLKDQRMALQWVQDNIAQFGGDPSQVVLAGQSGGAGSAVVQMMAYGGRDDHLFQAAALQSQSLQAVRDVQASQYQYDYIVGNTSCTNADDTLKCLRGVSIQGLVYAITNSPFPDGAGGDPVFPYNPVLDDDFLQMHPIVSYQKGQFVAVPTIFGDDTDEGTIFVSNRNAISSADDSHDFLRNTFPLINSTMLKHYDTMYNLTTDTESSDYWQKVAQAYGETRYTCPGMQLSDLVRSKNGGKVWNYRYDVTDPASESQGDGVKHGSEMPAVFGVPAGSSSLTGNTYAFGGQNADVVPLVQAYWTSFIKNRDPDAEKLGNSPQWDAWTGANRLRFVANATQMEEVDDGQKARCQYLNSISVAIGQ